jgi:PKD repeat protein
MLYPFTASWNFSVFNYNPVSPAYTILKNPDGESLEIAHPDSNFKTIGTFVEFGKLADTSGISTRSELMKRYLDFFGIPLGGPYALFHSDKNVAHRNESVGLFDDSFENILAWQWEFPGGSPSVSSEKNPVVVYPDFGKYDVRLTVTDGVDTASILKKGYISVVPGLGMEEKKDHPWYTVYPNPSEGLIRLAFSEASAEPVTIRVFDLMGRMILQKEANAFQGQAELTINLSSAGKGVYILRVSTGSRNKSSLVVVR